MPIIITGTPPHIIIIGMPAVIMATIFSQHSLNISIGMPSIGITVQVMAPSDMVQAILVIITGIIMPPIIGII